MARAPMNQRQSFPKAWSLVMTRYGCVVKHVEGASRLKERREIGQLEFCGTLVERNYSPAA